MFTLEIDRRFHHARFWFARLALLIACGCGTGSAGSATTSPAVPAAVEAIRYHAKNAYEFVRAGDWASARAALDSLAADTGSLRQVAATGADADSTGAAVSALDLALAGHHQIEAMTESNRLTRLGAELARVYDPPEPIEVAMLGYFGRELELGVAANDDPRLRRAATGIRENWRTLRPTVLGFDGADEAARFDDLVARLDVAGGRSDFARLSMSAIADVYGLEQLFAP